MQNQIVIHLQDEDCIYEIESVDLTVSDGLMDLEIKAKPNDDCVLGFLPNPVLTIEDATISAPDVAELNAETLDVKDGWESDGEEKEEDVFLIYLGQHTALDNNHLELKRLSENQIEISWKCDAVDFNYYDERAKRNPIEVHCVFESAN